MPLEIPTQPVPAQALAVLLGGQEALITIRQLSTGLYMNLVSNDVEIIGLVICENGNRIVRNRYLGFSGDLMIYDTTGNGGDPNYLELGTRFQLVYLTPEEAHDA